jgi:hypothetical protein
MKTFWRRIAAYVTGDLRTAAGVSEELLSRDENVDWLDHSVDEAVCRYALDASLHSAAHAEAAAEKALDKAVSLVTVVLTTFALALGGTGVALHTAHCPTWLQWASFGAFCGVDVMLLVAAMNAFLGTAPAATGGLNLKLMNRSQGEPIALLLRQEAHAWHISALLAMETSSRRARDVFYARRWLLAALGAAVPALIMTVVQTTS